MTGVEVARLVGGRSHVVFVTAYDQYAIQAFETGAVDYILKPVADVLFFQSDDKYTRVVTADNEALIKTPIRELLDGLDPAAFWQIHRSTLVNVNAIAAVTRDFRGQAHVKIK